MKFQSLLVIALYAILLSPALAQSDQASVDAGKYPDFNSIPDQLRGHLIRGEVFRERYISNTLSLVRTIGSNKLAITKADAEKQQFEATTTARQRQLAELLKYDKNFDAKVTREEISAFFAMTYKNEIASRIPQAVTGVMRYDTNHDDILSYEEMSALGTEPMITTRSLSGASDIPALLSLDPNQDGQLTTNELEGLARKAFRTVDTNDDGMLAQEELVVTNQYQHALAERQQLLRLQQQCSLPPPAADEKIVFLGAYEGQAVSAITIAGQEKGTDVVPVTIENGSGKLYVIAAAVSPIIWQLKGDTSRVGHVVLMGPTSPNEKLIQAGVSGVDRAKVAYEKNSCLPQSYWDMNGDAGRVRQTQISSYLKGLIGRDADIVAGAYSAAPVSLSDASAQFAKAPNIRPPTSKNGLPLAIPAPPAAPAGFDSGVWADALNYNPGGVIDLGNTPVVSQIPAERFKVLPAWVGLAKLVHDGVLVMEDSERSRLRAVLISDSTGGHVIFTENVDSIKVTDPAARISVLGGTSYRIVKELPYYPDGLAGSLSVRFIISKGIPVPKGDPGHSCVIQEETGKILSIASLCR